VGLLWGFSVADSRTNGPKATSRNPRFYWFFSFGMLLSSDTLGIHNPKIGGSIPPVATKPRNTVKSQTYHSTKGSMVYCAGNRFWATLVMELHINKGLFRLWACDLSVANDYLYGDLISGTSIYEIR